MKQRWIVIAYQGDDDEQHTIWSQVFRRKKAAFAAADWLRAMGFRADYFRDGEKS
jgi:hypothetical protein